MSYNNPLNKFIKPIERYIRLPSNKVFKYDDSVLNDLDLIEFGISGKSTTDELLLNNPEALMNGDAIKQLIQNNVPNIKNAGKILICDAHALLLGNKLASNEKSYDISSYCPKCGKEGLFERDIEYVLNTVKFFDHEISLDMGNGLHIFFTPLTLDQSNMISNNTFLQEQKIKYDPIIQKIENKDVEYENLSMEEKQSIISYYSATLNKSAELQLNFLIESISRIDEIDSETNEVIQSVTDKKYIGDYIKSLSSEDLTKVIKKRDEVDEYGVPTTMDVICNDEECKHEWTITNIFFNPSDFFGHGFSHQNQKK